MLWYVITALRPKLLFCFKGLCTLGLKNTSSFSRNVYIEHFYTLSVFFLPKKFSKAQSRRFFFCLQTLSLNYASKPVFSNLFQSRYPLEFCRVHHPKGWFTPGLSERTCVCSPMHLFFFYGLPYLHGKKTLPAWIFKIALYQKLEWTSPKVRFMRQFVNSLPQ